MKKSKLIKKLLLYIILFIFGFNSYCQTEIGKRIYMFKDPLYEPHEFEKIVLFNSEPEIQKEFNKILQKEGFNVINFNDLFPPIKEYKEDEIIKRLEELKIDALFIVEFKSINEKSYSIGSAGDISDITVFSGTQKEYIKALTLSISILKSYNEDPVIVVNATAKGGFTTSTIKSVSKKAFFKAIEGLKKHKFLPMKAKFGHLLLINEL